MATSTHRILMAALASASIASSAAQPDNIIEHKMLMDHGGGHLMDMEGGMVMGQNKDTMPPGCSSVSEERTITVRAGHKYAKDYPGTMFGFDTHEWRVKPCTRLTVNFINEDNIRHQWMMHGLPKFIYDKGMFHLEMTGPAKITGTLILPAEDKTYLVHCDIAQHMEKGMKGQLIVGKGSTQFPSIPGVTDPAILDDYGPKVVDKPKPVAQPAAQQTTGAATATASQSSSGTLMLGFVIGAFGVPFSLSYYRKRYAGMAPGEVVSHVLGVVKSTLDKAIGVVVALVSHLTRK